MGVMDVYKRRIEKLSGVSQKEYVKNQVRSSLETFLDISQYGMDVLINEEEARIGIMTNGMTDTRDEVLVLSHIGVLEMGTLFEWENDFWIVVKRQARVIQESFYGTAYRCNVDLKWVDDDGVFRSQKAYAQGRGMSAILVENKYTNSDVMAREVDTPITVITQRNLILEQDTRFLFGGQPYRVTFVDNMSIDGTTILGMYDDILQDGDDRELNIANYNNHYSIKLAFDPDSIILEPNEAFEVKAYILNDGVIDGSKNFVIIGDEEKVHIDGNVITPLVAEDIGIIIELEDNELISTSFIAHSGTEWTTDNVFIVGQDRISWDTEATYRLNTNEDAEFIFSFPDRVNYTMDVKDNEATIGVGNKYSGTIELIVLTASSETFTKSIEITSAEVI